MKTVLVTGGSGFIGRAVSQALIARGDRVTVLTRNVEKTRRTAPPGVRVAGWSPNEEGPWYDELDKVDAVVHLAGEVVAQRWSESKKKQIVDSRVGSTNQLILAISRANHKPQVLVSASATGYYGARSTDEELTETSEKGKGFLSDLVAEWESAAQKAEEHGVRTAMMRIGIVFGKGGGALEKMVMPFKLFAGGPVGDGKQIYSWIHIEDVAGLILAAIDDERFRGPVNATSPYPASAAEVAKTIGITMNRPSFFRVPKAVAGLILGEAAEIMTDSQRVIPRKAIDLGYEFHYARLLPALESILGS